MLAFFNKRLIHSIEHSEGAFFSRTFSLDAAGKMHKGWLLPRLLKGYGQTHCAGREEFQRRVQDYRVSPAELTAWLEHR